MTRDQLIARANRALAIVKRRDAGETLQAIGDSLQLTKSRISQIEKMGRLIAKHPSRQKQP